LGLNGELVEGAATAVLFLASSYCCNAKDLHRSGAVRDDKSVQLQNGLPQLINSKSAVALQQCSAPGAGDRLSCGAHADHSDAVHDVSSINLSCIQSCRAKYLFDVGFLALA
jgi:hypothetical protein